MTSDYSSPSKVPVSEASSDVLSRNLSTDPFHRSPHRHRHRTVSATREIKETHNARSEHVNSEDDGASQRRINQYLIQQEIGRGSFGSVHVATDQFGHEYAVKEFSKSRLRRRAKSNLLRQSRQQNRPRGARGGEHRLKNNFLSDEDNNAFDLIKEEIAIMKKLNHQNLVSLFEVLDDPEEDSLFMVLEMCKKGVVMRLDIDEHVEPYNEENCRFWFRDLILGIEYLHAQGVIHRDIKPDNCLLTDDDTLKLVDFGVSEMFEKSSDMKIAKSAGSPAFMAPELCKVSNKGVYGKPADIWSMGVTLFCLLFGHVPFQKSNMLDLYESIVHDAVEIPRRCSNEARHLLLRILEKDPEKRITMDELREHPWVTNSGDDPLLSSEENCASHITPPTEEDVNHAITGNMGGLMIVLKAAGKFKSLLEDHHPTESILGQDSQLVSPPGTIQDTEPSGFGIKSAFRNPFSRSSNPSRGTKSRAILGGPEVLHEVPVDRQLNRVRDQLDGTTIQTRAFPSQLRRLVPRGEGYENCDEPRRHTYDEYTKGHAHDVLVDHVFVDIGSGPPNDTSDEYNDNDANVGNTLSYAVSESPPPTEESIFEIAYEKEVESIRQSRRQATIYSTRRVDSKAEMARQGHGGESGEIRTKYNTFADSVGKAFKISGNV